MGAIILGKLHLRWCDSCNVPVLEQKSCGICGSETRAVKLTPPGDARPAFEKDMERLRTLIDSQFGAGTGPAIVPEGRVVLLNKAPDIDRTDEVIVDGEVVGAVRFSISSGERFLLRPKSASLIAPLARRGWVKVDPVAADAIRTKSASTLAVGVTECDPAIDKGQEILVLDESGRAVSVGTSKMNSAEMMAHMRGTAVKTRWIVDGQGDGGHKNAGWEEVLAANREVLGRRVKEATEFIRKTVKESELPVAVSYSGGKDSLATLHLVLDAGIRPKMIFVDTGLEFEETKENVRSVAESLSLELIVESAGEAFWDNIERFGPPAKDFRWCCKTCKLGPATQLIQKNFPGGVLSFIGQRAYESQQRAEKGRIWRNPWTPNQLAASPIQKWTAMHVWMYLFSKGADFNPLYREGLERIGCFMCPATDLAELRLVRRISPQYARWQEHLDRYAERTGQPKQWLGYDLWRWKKIPESVLNELGPSEKAAILETRRVEEEAPLEFRSTSGYNPCTEGLSSEGVFSRPLPMDRVSNLLNALGEVTTSPDGAIAEVRSMTVFAEGPVMVRARDEAELRKKTSQLREVVLRAFGCAGCGICVARCPTGALMLEGVAKIDPARCDHCGKCLGPCPAVKFRADELDI
ncbi:MAG: phosphoadenosine phosphosulfate reductase family protein [Candidatus Thermoplasmatota archaeon]|nr:phosphoadenosine phosphosulfate reductase family protein [Candidatus Thermoplasmatota archaeon]